MNELHKQAGEANMKNSERNLTQSSEKGSAAVLGAGLLILVGLGLQWFEMLCSRFISENSWFFATLFSEAWNMINVWLSAAPWHQDLQFWPLLLVITGAAILFARGPQAAMAKSESRTGVRRES
jgi:hypothetical protein